jgi:DNA-binding response OmpR family regulator
MQNASQPSDNDAIALLKAALAEGHAVTFSLTAPPRIDRARLELSLGVTCCLEFGLTLAESRAFVALLKHECLTKPELHAAIARDGAPATDAKVVGVTIHWLRKKLSHRGIEIISIYGVGYKLARGARARARELLAEHGMDIDVIAPATPGRAEAIT